MEARESDLVRTLVDVRTSMKDRLVPAGTTGVVVDAPREGQAQIYYVDVGTPGDYDNISLAPGQFEVIVD